MYSSLLILILILNNKINLNTNLNAYIKILSPFLKGAMFINTDDITNDAAAFAKNI